jgi:RNA polymerase sigma-70 factor, ECF subfamily
MTTLHIWNTFEQRLNAFIFQKVRDSELAKDILQDVFEKIHLKLDTLQTKDKLESWLFAITRNAVNDHFRKQKPQVEIKDDMLIMSDENTKPNKELIDCLIPFFKQLPSPYKEVLYDYQFLNIPQKQIAINRNVAHSTIRSQVKRARKILHDQFLCCCHEQLEVAEISCGRTTPESDC